MRGVDHPATADIQPDMMDGAIEEDEIAGS
jgi:hypothetical protein